VRQEGSEAWESHAGEHDSESKRQYGKLQEQCVFDEREISEPSECAQHRSSVIPWLGAVR
jgi:hypothetical protein